MKDEKSFESHIEAEKSSIEIIFIMFVKSVLATLFLSLLLIIFLNAPCTTSTICDLAVDVNLFMPFVQIFKATRKTHYLTIGKVKFDFFISTTSLYCIT